LVRTHLLAPLLMDEMVIGVIALTRDRVEPFTDRQIDVIVGLAAQATIALECSRESDNGHYKNW
jgi:GAF domain-containing protein